MTNNYPSISRQLADTMNKHFDRQIFHEACPWCGSNQNVFIGHGTVRHCADCVLNWAEGERITKSATKATVQEKIQTLPNDIKRRVNETRRGLRQASGLRERLRRLRAISDTEWQEAVDASP